jgi:UDP-N-acetylglucosamine--N-acetylmuramyl-(pentapeptide) pyrophosphoryl-undecaprenol N-acetylglucosamine transferase
VAEWTPDDVLRIPLRPAITGLDRPALRDAARQRFGL